MANNSKKILLATGIFPPDIGGPATYVENLAIELEKLGHKVRVVTYSSEKIPNNKSQITNKSQIPNSKSQTRLAEPGLAKAPHQMA